MALRNWTTRATISSGDSRTSNRWPLVSFSTVSGVDSTNSMRSELRRMDSEFNRVTLIIGLLAVQDGCRRYRGVL